MAQEQTSFWLDGAPGSDVAIARGCTCPVLDNEHGAGFGYMRGEIVWIVAPACPVHGQKQDNPRHRAG
jgi:hypothetical protein